LLMGTAIETSDHLSAVRTALAFLVCTAG
jgi:hypothetical protein